jgi:hypothetical protein
MMYSNHEFVICDILYPALRGDYWINKMKVNKNENKNKNVFLPT